MSARVRIMESQWRMVGDDDATLSRFVSCNARNRRAILKSRASRREFLAALRESGHFDASGCDCGHCAAGWDCCARLFPSWSEVIAARHGVRVVQHWTRNI